MLSRIFYDTAAAGETRGARGGGALSAHAYRTESEKYQHEAIGAACHGGCSLARRRRQRRKAHHQAAQAACELGVGERRGSRRGAVYLKRRRHPGITKAKTGGEIKVSAYRKSASSYRKKRENVKPVRLK